jgi:hypothetical protein
MCKCVPGSDQSNHVWSNFDKEGYLGEYLCSCDAFVFAILFVADLGAG